MAISQDTKDTIGMVTIQDVGGLEQGIKDRDIGQVGRSLLDPGGFFLNRDAIEAEQTATGRHAQAQASTMADMLARSGGQAGSQLGKAAEQQRRQAQGFDQLTGRIDKEMGINRIGQQTAQRFDLDPAAQAQAQQVGDPQQIQAQQVGAAPGVDVQVSPDARIQAAQAAAPGAGVQQVGAPQGPQDMQAAQLATGAADQSRGTQQQLQQDLLAQSRGDSELAQRTLAQAQDANMANALALQASGRGRVNAGQLQRQAQESIVQSGQIAGREAGNLALQQQAQAQQALGQFAGQARGQDIQQAGAQAQLQQQAALANQQAGLAGSQMGLQADLANQQAGLAGRGQDIGLALSNAQMQQQASMANQGLDVMNAQLAQQAGLQTQQLGTQAGLQSAQMGLQADQANQQAALQAAMTNAQLGTQTGQFNAAQANQMAQAAQQAQIQQEQFQKDLNLQTDQLQAQRFAQLAGLQTGAMGTQAQALAGAAGTLATGAGLQQQGLQGAANINLGIAGNESQFALANQQAQQQQQAGVMGMVGSVLGAFSDERLKEDFQDPTQDMDEFVNALTANKYKYKDDIGEVWPGDQYGPIAQMLEKTKVGSSFVKDTPRGKVIDYGSGFNALVAAMGHLNQKIEAKNE